MLFQSIYYFLTSTIGIPVSRALSAHSCAHTTAEVPDQRFSGLDTLASRNHTSPIPGCALEQQLQMSLLLGKVSNVLCC